MTASNIFTKDPDAVLDYVFDWAPNTNGTPDGTTDWLSSGETISTKTITATTGITVDSSTITDTNTSVTVWLSGGAAGQNYTVSCEIVTSANRTDERSIVVQVVER
jgi:hypothetical protein